MLRVVTLHRVCGSAADAIYRMARPTYMVALCGAGLRLCTAFHRVPQIKQDGPGQCKTRPPLSVILVAADFALTVAAITPGPAAASAAATAPAASPAAPAAATSAAATAATPGSYFLADLRRCGIFLVEHIERRQADVRDFLLAKKDLMFRRGVLRRDIRRDSTGRCGRSARQ
jgi:hypothetical protein